MTRIVETRMVSSAGRSVEMPEPDLPEVAFAGRSNVGKSSLLNAVCGRRRLFEVSKTPGRTRTIVHARARLDSEAEIYLVDLPGYGYAKVSKRASKAWASLVEGYLSDRPTLHLVVVLVDVRRGPEQEEADLLDFLGDSGIPALLVATKIDRVAKSKRRAALDRLRRDTGTRVVGVSAATGEGLDQLLKTVVRACGFG